MTNGNINENFNDREQLSENFDESFDFAQLMSYLEHISLPSQTNSNGTWSRPESLVAPSKYDSWSSEFPASMDNTANMQKAFSLNLEHGSQDSLDPSPEMALPLGIARDPPPASKRHICRRLPNTDNETLDSWLKYCDTLEPRLFICTWVGCPVTQPFEGRSKARIHIRRHLKIEKLYECIVCGKRFVSQGTAKRHTDTQERNFSCNICHMQFARKDYRRVHQRKCRRRPLDDPPGSGETLFAP
ncbi:hypothetical protein K439DRAFT_969430 [Ramaria rubella]|nr:hypothetical protein K439DRAFT_969430 [Ramaria rubella]